MNMMGVQPKVANSDNMRPGPRTKILGTGSYLPDRVLTNADLEKMVDTSDAWITERTGIRERRVAAEGQCTSDLALHAARKAIEASGISVEDLDLIIVGTVTPDMPLPSTAVILQRKLSPSLRCPAFDLSAACAGFVYGMSMGDAMIASGKAKHVLVVGVELLSRVMNWKDRSTCVLFGDGAGAAVLGPSDDGHGILSTHLFSDGTLSESLCIPAGGSRVPASLASVAEQLHTVHMHGQDIFKIAVKYLALACEHALADNAMKAEEIAWVVSHQANIRILDAVARRCGVPLERFCLNLEKYGNTSSASLPIALDELVRGGRVQPGQHLLFCALGGGIAWGSAIVRW